MSYDINQISNEFGAWWGSDGIPVEIGGWTFRLKPLNERNRAWVNWQVKHPDLREVSQFIPVLPQMLLECSVSGWGGATDITGTPIPFEAAQDVFEAHPALAMEVFLKAVDLGSQQDQSAKEAIETLGKPDIGPVDTEAA